MTGLNRANASSITWGCPSVKEGKINIWLASYKLIISETLDNAVLIFIIGDLKFILS